MRPSFDTYHMAFAELAATRATCPRASVGAAVVRENAMLVTGYNGAPADLPHCTDQGCLLVDGHCTRATHAEANAIALAARRGVALQGATLYLTHAPCYACSHLIIAAGITRVDYAQTYGDAGQHHETIARLLMADVDVRWAGSPLYRGLA